jgi:sulfide:quinone oxidoreductase
MSAWTSPVARRRVIIAGGGIAGLEALMALADLGDGQLDLELVAPRDHFRLRPQIVGEPWGGPVLQVDLAALCAAFGARFRRAGLAFVDAAARTASFTDGVRPFDELLVAIGAVASVPYRDARVLGFGPLPDVLGTEGRADVAIVVPPGTSWTLPAYELALLVATRSHRRVRVLTPERAPCEVFGDEPASAVAGLLARHGVRVELGCALGPATDLSELAELVVALPLIDGPALPGLRHDARGFLPVGENLAVVRADEIHAAGDVVTGTIKQGGLAAQQAEAAAIDIVRRAGGRLPHPPYAPVLRGKLTAGDGSELYLRRRLDGLDVGDHNTDPLWTVPGVVCARRLARWLDARREELGDHALEHVAQPVPATSDHL